MSNRPHGLRWLVAIFLSLLAGSEALAAEPVTAPSRPNIVLIFADDLGFSDLGCFGGEIPTPNIDRLAGKGVRFTQFYNNAWCCPSRASLLTGRYPHQVGIGTNIDGYTKAQRDAADSPAYADQLSPDSPTAAELLRDAGYHTMMVGKWHLGYRPKAWPHSRGFDRTFALVGGAMNYFGSTSDGAGIPPMELNGEKYVPPADGFFATDAFTDRAVEFLREAKEVGKPFFLYAAYNAPHWPLHARPEEIARHRGKYRDGWQPARERRYARLGELGVIDGRVALAPMDRGRFAPWARLTDAERDEQDLRMAVYAAMVERVDHGVGRLVEALRETGAYDNTLVVFVSDNGGAAEEPNRGRPGAVTGSRDSFAGYARPWATVSNTPFRNHKVSIYEGGISAPMVVAWPGRIPADRRGGFVREPAHLIDLLPSFLSLAGAAEVAARPELKLEGQSIVDMLTGAPGRADRTFAWEHSGHRGIRSGKWKLVRLPDAPDWSLFDLQADRAEQHDLLAEHPDVARDLATAYDRWAERCGVIPWEQLSPAQPATRN